MRAPAGSGPFGPDPTIVEYVVEGEGGGNAGCRSGELECGIEGRGDGTRERAEMRGGDGEIVEDRVVGTGGRWWGMVIGDAVVLGRAER